MTLTFLEAIEFPPGSPPADGAASSEVRSTAPARCAGSCFDSENCPELAAPHQIIVHAE